MQKTLETDRTDTSFTERTKHGKWGLIRYCNTCGWTEHLRCETPSPRTWCSCCNGTLINRPATRKDFEKYDSSQNWEAEKKRWREHCKKLKRSVREWD
jgi:hypothetical protein